MASIISKVQTALGAKADGIWGTKSQKALNTEIALTGANGSPTLRKIQNLLDVEQDGFWGPISQRALIDAIAQGAADGVAGSVFKATASSFADPADVDAFRACKAQGKSDQACFKVGDNGIGQFGQITAQMHTPMVALHKSDMIARWGSVDAAAHRIVKVTVKGKTIQARVEDRLGVAGRIDLNPAAAEELGLKPPFLIPNCTWSWA